MEALELSRELLRFNTINPPGDERASVQRLARAPSTRRRAP